MKDGVLSGALGLDFVSAGKTAGEEQGRRFRNDDNSLSDFASEQIRRCGLSAARATGQDDAQAAIGLFFKWSGHREGSLSGGFYHPR